MALRPPSLLDEPEVLPDLKHGVPGVQWANPDDTPPTRPGLGGHRPAPAAANPDDKESYVLYLSLIFGIALLLRLLIVFMGPVFGIEQAYTADSPTQLTLAENLAEHQTFGLAAQPDGTVPAALDQLRASRGELTQFPETGLTPEVYRSPGYPAVLAVFHLTGLPLTLLLILQCFIGAAAVPLVYKLGLGVIGRKAPATLAAALVALHPAMLIAPAGLTGDVIVIALVLAACGAVANAHRRDVRSAALGGLAAGTAALFAPLYLWLAPILGVWMILTERRARSLGLAAVLLLAAALPVGGWGYRNAGHGPEVALSAQPAVDRYFGTVAAAMHPAAGPFAPATNTKLFNQLATQTQSPAHVNVSTLTLLDQSGRQWLLAHPAEHARTVIGRTAQHLALDHSLDDAYRRLAIDYAPAGHAATLLGEPVASATPAEAVTEWVINAWVGLNALLVAGMAVGAAMMLWHRRIAGLLLLVAGCGLVLFFSTAGASESMRLPVLGLQALLVTAALAPAPARVPKLKKRKLRKIKKLKEQSEQLDHRGSPLATPDSLRPNDPEGVGTPLSRQTDDALEHAADDLHDLARTTAAEVAHDAPAEAPDPQHALHPALRNEPQPAADPTPRGGRPI